MDKVKTNVEFKELKEFTQMLLAKPLTETAKSYHLTTLKIVNSLLSFRLSDDQYQKIDEIINQ